jgi:hypothetical protein
LFKGYQLIGKPRGITQEILASHAELQARSKMPIDVCMVHPSVVPSAPEIAGVRYVARSYMSENEWYFGNLASAQ